MIKDLKLLSYSERIDILRRILILKTKRKIATIDDWRVLALIEEELPAIPKAA